MPTEGARLSLHGLKSLSSRPTPAPAPAPSPSPSPQPQPPAPAPKCVFLTSGGSGAVLCLLSLYVLRWPQLQPPDICIVLLAHVCPVSSSGCLETMFVGAAKNGLEGLGEGRGFRVQCSRHGPTGWLPTTFDPLHRPQHSDTSSVSEAPSQGANTHIFLP